MATSVFTNRPAVAWTDFVTFISWLGMYVHNLVDLPQLSLLSPENSAMAVGAGLLFFAWWRFPGRLTCAALLGLGLLHLLGGAVFSVLPLPFLPFVPAQTGLHYAMHGLYGAAQLPLIGLMARQMRQGG